MTDLGRMLAALGFLLLVIGGALLLAGRMGLPLGKLPGDFHWRGRHTEVFAPLGTSLLLSALLTLVLALLNHLRR